MCVSLDATMSSPTLAFAAELYVITELFKTCYFSGGAVPEYACKYVSIVLVAFAVLGFSRSPHDTVHACAALAATAMCAAVVLRY